MNGLEVSFGEVKGFIHLQDLDSLKTPLDQFAAEQEVSLSLIFEVHPSCLPSTISARSNHSLHRSDHKNSSLLDAKSPVLLARTAIDPSAQCSIRHAGSVAVHHRFRTILYDHPKYRFVNGRSITIIESVRDDFIDSSDR